MPYKSLPLGAFWTIFGQNFPTGVPQLLYPYQPANPLVESIFKALKILKNFKNFKNFALYLGDRAYPRTETLNSWTLGLKWPAAGAEQFMGKAV